MRKVFITLLVPALLFLSSCGRDEGLSLEEQLALDIVEIDRYLDDNNIDAQIHSSGIRYVETAVGTGRSPISGEIAVIKYDLSVIGSEDIIGLSEYGDSFILDNNMFRALFITLQEMKEGGKWTIYASSVYGAGERGTSLIPPGSNLLINIELLSVVRNEDEQFAADLAVIDGFLTDNDIQNVLIHESGIRYTVQRSGNGASPTLEDVVTVSYRGNFLNGIIFDQNAQATFGLNSLIEAWKIMIPTMKQGDKISIYAPSRLCYGTMGNQSILPNTNLVFEIDLLSIEE